MLTKIYNKISKRGIITYRFYKIFINIFYPIIVRFSRKKILPKDNPEYIVSLTTFGKRAKRTWITLETLIRQERQPDLIILWLSSEEFNDKNLPKSLVRMKGKGIVIKYCEDLKPHKKYFFSMKNYPEAYIITVDDDTFYPGSLIKNFLDYSNKFPNTILCNVAKVININGNRIEKYSTWPHYNTPFILNKLLIPIGVGGVFYPPNTLHPEVFNIKNIKETSLFADDLWLKSMGILNRTKYALISNNFIPVEIMTRNKIALTDINVKGGKNDEQMKNIIDIYPIIKEKLLTKNEV